MLELLVCLLGFLCGAAVMLIFFLDNDDARVHRRLMYHRGNVYKLTRIEIE